MNLYSPVLLFIYMWVYLIICRHPKNTNVVESMVKALARVVSTIQMLCTDALEVEMLKLCLKADTTQTFMVGSSREFTYIPNSVLGIEWSLDSDASNAAVLVASEAHAITLAIEGLLGVVFTVATLTDEAVDMGELDSPRCESDPPAKLTGRTALLCVSMVDSMWLTILDALSFILANVVQSPGSKRSEALLEPRETVVLTPKNVLETLASLDRAIHSPHATTQEVSTAVPKFTRDSSGQYSDFHILSSLNSQLFESSALMHVSAVKSLLSALRQLSHQCMSAAVSGFGPPSSQKSGSIASVTSLSSDVVQNLTPQLRSGSS
ncbi:hypothetical protein RND71_042238 [Anisodus tanguticus]|uniref:Uncharacterized protein n=1 Tax=Anisodus tanguticus TaxID=243964 RepID=A0AAE1US28_9SOLA|nr:hypothetical protein RND71_042238 [Anisodus tanguticus]